MRKEVLGNFHTCMFTQKGLTGKLVFMAILLVGAIFRFVDVNWDSGYMLHPDERFLVMLTEALQLPPSLLVYLDPQLSLLNPENVNYGFYVYGVFPLFLTKLFGELTGMNVYNDLALLGRTMTAVVDTLVIILVYQIAKLFEQYRKWPTSVKYWAAFAYAISVLPIQLAHFYTVDPFLNLFVTASIYYMLRFYFTGSVFSVILSGVFLSAGLASKISAVYVVPLLAALYFFAYRKELLELTLVMVRIIKNTITEKEFHAYLPSAGSLFLRIVGAGLLVAVVSYIALRFFNPYYFETASFLNIQLNEQWLTNIDQLKSFEGIGVWYPPAIQWMTKPAVSYALWNMAILGFGVPLFLLVIVGLFLFFDTAVTITRKKTEKRGLSIPFGKLRVVFHSPELLLILFWILAFFLYQSTQFVKALRYFFFLYPLLAVAAGFAMAKVLGVLQRKTPIRTSLTGFALVLVVMIWPLMFLNIYIQPHSRVQASQWIHDNLEDGYVLSEHWDDPLPLRVPNSYKQFPGEQMEVFGADTDEKFAKMEEQMNRAQYYILSSNRGWGSMPTVPGMYPRMGQFYNDLFQGRLGYRIVREFTVYPSLEYLGIPLTLPDDWADETFTVYDHPKVIIMENESDPVPASVTPPGLFQP